MPLVLRRRDRQKEQSDEVSEQVSTGCQNLVPKELDPIAGSTNGSATKNRVKQLAVEIGEICHEMITLIEFGRAEAAKTRSGSSDPSTTTSSP